MWNFEQKKTKERKKEQNSLKIWLIGIFLQNLALICLKVSEENKFYTWTNDGRLRHDISSAV